MGTRVIIASQPCQGLNPIRAASIPHVSLFEIDLMAPQEFPHFILEGDLPTVNRPSEPFNPFRIGRRLSREFPKDSSDWAA